VERWTVCIAWLLGVSLKYGIGYKVLPVGIPLETMHGT